MAEAVRQSKKMLQAYTLTLWLLAAQPDFCAISIFYVPAGVWRPVLYPSSFVLGPWPT